MGSSDRSGTDGLPVAPVVRDGVVPRPGLFDLLGRAGRVTEVSAPAGSGKTVLLRSWIGETGLAERAAWVPVRGEERDPQRFWLSLLGAVRETAAGSTLVRPLTAAPDLDGGEVVERLLTDLGGLGDRVWLVIDDVHELRSDEALGQLELLIMRGPPELRFVLATRHDLRLGLHRLRLEGELTEIRAADLRFTLEEARALFEAAGMKLSDRALGLLYERTEGWVAGLRLAALSLAGHPDPDRFAAEFSGSERTVAEYLLAEVLERQPEPVRRLLLRTSVLDRVNGELADLLTGGAGGERVLQQLEQANAFVVALDARRSWFRYHQLFADLLQLELRGSAPADLPALHAAAAGWYAEHGYPIEAVRHAEAAQDWDLAARVLSDHWVGLGLNGLGATAHELLARFPAGVIAADTELAARMAEHELERGSLEKAERYLTMAARGLESVPPDRRGRPQVALAVVRLRFARQRGDLTAVAEQAQQLLAPAEAADPARFGVGEDLRALALISLGIAEALDRSSSRRRTGTWSRASPWRTGSGGPSWRSPAWRTGRSWRAGGLSRSGRSGAGRRSSWPGGTAGPRSRSLASPTWRWAWRWSPRAGSKKGSGALEQAERTLRAEVEPAAGMRLRYARGLLDLVSGRPEAALSAFRAAERAGRAARDRARPGQAAAIAHAADARAAGPDAARRTGSRRDGRAGARQRTDAQRHGGAPARPGRSEGGDGRPRPRHRWLCPADERQPLGGSGVAARGDRPRRARRAGAARRALERALNLAKPEGLLFPFLLDPAPGLLDRHRRLGTAHAALISEILNLLAGRQPGAPPDGEGARDEQTGSGACASRSAKARSACCATCPPSCPRRRSPTSSTCRSTPSRPTCATSTTSSACTGATRPSSRPARSACWRLRAKALTRARPPARSPSAG